MNACITTMKTKLLQNDDLNGSKICWLITLLS